MGIGYATSKWKMLLFAVFFMPKQFYHENEFCLKVTCYTPDYRLELSRTHTQGEKERNEAVMVSFLISQVSPYLHTSTNLFGKNGKLVYGARKTE